jgi:hypothetical protein
MSLVPGADLGYFGKNTKKIAMHSFMTKSICSLYLTLAFASFTAVAADSPDFKLHEWGTFTSVSGSDGVLLPGLQTEEEPLPTFIYSHEGMEPFAPKGWMRPLQNVTIKMETPVIYFYASQPFEAHVHVGFNGGSISQWFPARSGGETPPPAPKMATFGSPGGDIDFAKGYNGSIEWNVQVQPSSEGDGAAVFKPGATPTWLYPRQTDSALLRTKGGEAEKFLFYRGVGNFSLPVKFALPDDGTLHIQNDSKAAIPAMLIFNHPRYGDQVSFVLLDSLKAGGTRTVKLSDPVTSTNWQHEVYATMRDALVQAGLFPKEADAMLQTWWSSYFEHPGLRVFWIVPENFTRAVLPLTVEPSPREQTRVLVGRSELLTPAFEQELLKQFAQGEQNPLRNDRFVAAYAARVNALKTGN